MTNKMLTELTRLHAGFVENVKATDRQNASIPCRQTHNGNIAALWKMFKSECAMTILIKSGCDYSRDLAMYIAENNLG
jgi:hypothetical protein